MDLIVAKEYQKSLRFFAQVTFSSQGVFFEHLLVEKENGAKRLVLSRRGNISVDGKMRQKGFNLFDACLLGVAFVVIKD